MSSVRRQIFNRPAQSANRILPCRSNLLHTRPSQSPSPSSRRKLARTDLVSPVPRRNQKSRKMVPAMRRQLQKLLLLLPLCRSRSQSCQSAIVCGGPSLEWGAMPDRRGAALHARANRYRFVSSAVHNRHRRRAEFHHATQERSSTEGRGLLEKSNIKGVHPSRRRLRHEHQRIPELPWRGAHRMPAARSDHNLDQ